MIYSKFEPEHILSEHEGMIPVKQCLLRSCSLYPDVRPTSWVAIWILLFVTNLLGTISISCINLNQISELMLSFLFFAGDRGRRGAAHDGHRGPRGGVRSDRWRSRPRGLGELDREAARLAMQLVQESETEKRHCLQR